MIVKIFNFIVGSFCQHKWKTLHVLRIVERNEDKPVAYNYHQQCEKCGDVRKKYLSNS